MSNFFKYLPDVKNNQPNQINTDMKCDILPMHNIFNSMLI